MVMRKSDPSMLQTGQEMIIIPKNKHKGKREAGRV